MYLAKGDGGYESDELRQGDILTNIPFPLLEHGEMRILGNLSSKPECVDKLPACSTSSREVASDNLWVTIQVPARFGFFVVTSHCCELERRNGKIRPAFLTLARMRLIQDQTRNNAKKFASLRANKDSSDANDPGYKDLFYLEPHKLIDGKDWSVHFDQIITLPTSDIEILLARKVLQMDDRTRAKFKTKLAFSIGKYTDEECAVGLDEPWNEAVAASASAGPMQNEPDPATPQAAPVPAPTPPAQEPQGN